MDFERSTQARSWIFDEASLAQCREKIISERASARRSDGTSKVRKGASGYCRRHHGDAPSGSSDEVTLSPISLPCDFVDVMWEQSTLTSNEQDVLVRFHAHQITGLIGPDAILPSLVRSPEILATAIIFFRRFYLSNSILDFPPRTMAVAAAFLASKVEDQRVEMDILEHATDLIQQRVKAAPLCRQELCYVTVDEIEIAERDLMEGINYEMRCHHPFNAVRVLAGEVEKFLCRNDDAAYYEFFERRRHLINPESPRSTLEIRDDDESYGDSFEEHATLYAQNALLFSDVPFLFPPGQIAFAAVAMSMRSDDDASGLPLTLRTYLRDRFVSKTEDELLVFEDQVSLIVSKLLQSPVMDMKTIEMSRNSEMNDRVVAEQACELRRVFCKVTNIRSSPRTVQQSPIPEVGRKRKLFEATSVSPISRSYRKVVKVTPTKL